MASPLDPVVPGLHAHMFDVDPRDDTDFPALHTVHAPGPASGLYVSNAHRLHKASPSGPVDPALQLHTFVSEAVTKEYFPDLQLIHMLEPGAALNVPTAHG